MKVYYIQSPIFKLSFSNIEKVCNFWTNFNSSTLKFCENLRLLKCPILGICKGLCRFVTLYKMQCWQLYLFWLSWKKMVNLCIKIEKLATLINLNTWWTHKKFSLVEWKNDKNSSHFCEEKRLKNQKKTSSSTRKKKLYRGKNSLWLGLLLFHKNLSKNICV